MHVVARRTTSAIWFVALVVALVAVVYRATRVVYFRLACRAMVKILLVAILLVRVLLVGVFLVAALLSAVLFVAITIISIVDKPAKEKLEENGNEYCNAENLPKVIDYHGVWISK